MKWLCIGYLFDPPPLPLPPPGFGDGTLGMFDAGTPPLTVVPVSRAVPPGGLGAEGEELRPLLLRLVAMVDTCLSGQMV